MSLCLNKSRLLLFITIKTSQTMMKVRIDFSPELSFVRNNKDTYESDEQQQQIQLDVVLFKIDFFHSTVRSREETMLCCVKRKTDYSNK